MAVPAACHVEEAALAWLGASGWQIAHGPDIALDMPPAARKDRGEAVGRFSSCGTPRVEAKRQQ